MKTDRKLISSIEYGKTLINEQAHDYMTKRNNYDALLGTQLELGQFVPCDLEGNVLSEPHNHGSGIKTFSEMDYQDAKDRVVFEGFEFQDSEDLLYYYIRDAESQITIAIHKELKQFNYQYKTIEDVVKLNIGITPQAVETYKI